MVKDINYNFNEKLVVYIISSVVGVVLITLALLLAAAVCLSADMGETYDSVLSGVCIGVGTLVAGFVASKKIRTGGIINGLICAVAIYLLIFLLSLVINGGPITLATLYHCLIAILCGAIGGVLGVNSSRKRKLI